MADGTNFRIGSISREYSDVVYHEYTHNIIYHLYGLQFIGVDPEDEGRAMDEGLADYWAATLNGNSFINLVNRDLQNTLKFPTDYDNNPPGDPWGNGRIVGGAAWDLRQLLDPDPSTTDLIIFKALQMTPHAFDFSEFMDNVLIADDTDGTLGNGTPNQSSIQTAFTTNHGITSNVLNAIPVAPSNLSATALSSSKIRINWTDNSPGELGFKIERKKSTQSIYSQIATVSYNVTTYTNTGLDASTTYNYRVRAYNNTGNSAYSNVASATTQAPPPPITSVTISGPDPVTVGIKNFYTVSVTGGSGNFDYQWYKRDSASGSNYYWYEGWSTTIDVMPGPTTFALRVDVTDNVSSEFAQGWKGVGGASTPTKPVVAQLPSSYSLGPNAPNPFNPSTTIQFALPEATYVRLEIYNVAGQRVRTLIDGLRPAGHHIVQWNGRSEQGQPVASGLYFYRLTTDEFVEQKKMTLLK